MQKTFTTHNGKTVSFDVVIDETFHKLAIEGINPNKKALLSLVNDFESGVWRKSKYYKYLWDNIKETALSKGEREALIGREYSSLVKSSQNVKFTDTDEDDKGGEIGEIMLYGIMKDYYSALPVVPKIFYKQNANDYAKGADSVHIVLEADDTFSLWLGEAKFYNKLDSTRFGKILSSIEAMLDMSKLRKELTIVTSLKDLELLVLDTKIVEEIKKALSEGISLDEIKKRLHVPILLLHECEITENNIDDITIYKQNVIKKHIELATEFMKKQELKLNNIYGYTDICFHLVLFPVPNKKDIVENFRNKIVTFRDD